MSQRWLLGEFKRYLNITEYSIGIMLSNMLTGT